MAAGQTLVIGGFGGGGGGGSVTDVSVATANGFSGVVATSTTTPSITIRSTGTSTYVAFANATSGLSYSSGLTLNATEVLSLTAIGTVSINASGTATVVIGTGASAGAVTIGRTSGTLTTIGTHGHTGVFNVTGATTVVGAFTQSGGAVLITGSGGGREVGIKTSTGWLTLEGNSTVSNNTATVTITKPTAGTNDVAAGILRNLTSTGTAANGFGWYDSWFFQYAAGSQALTSQQIVRMTNATTLATDHIISVHDGTSLYESFNIKSTGGFSIKNGSSGSAVTIKPHASTGAWTFTLPSGAGTSNQVLATDGSGNTSWATPSGGGGVPTLSTAAVLGAVTANSQWGVFDTGNAWAGYPNSMLVYLWTVSGSAVTSVATGGTSGTGYMHIGADGTGIWTTTTGSGNHRKTTDYGATWSNITNPYGSSAAQHSRIVRGGDNGASTTWMWLINGTTSAVRSTNNLSTLGLTGSTGVSAAMLGIMNDNTGGTGTTEWMIVTTTGVVKKSTDDGATWSAGTTVTGSPTCTDISYLNGNFCVWTTDGNIYYTPNTSTGWTAVPVPAGDSIKGVTHYNSKYWLLDANNTLWSCPDITATTPQWTRVINLPINMSSNRQYPLRMRTINSVTHIFCSTAIFKLSEVI